MLRPAPDDASRVDQVVQSGQGGHEPGRRLAVAQVQCQSRQTLVYRLRLTLGCASDGDLCPLRRKSPRYRQPDPRGAARHQNCRALQAKEVSG